MTPTIPELWIVYIEDIPLIIRFLNFYWNESFSGSFLIVNNLVENSVRFFGRVCYNENWKEYIFYEIFNKSYKLII